MLRHTLLASALLLLPAAASAASGDMLSGSGASAAIEWEGDRESETVQSQREDRAATLRLDLVQDRKADAQFRQRTAAFVRKRAELRRDCREDLRRSNRDTRLPVLLRCTRADIALEREQLSKTHERVQALPGPSDTIRSAALSRVDILADALDTVMFAIDSGVYRSSEDLMEARKNLLQRYRVPLADALVSLRADRAGALAGALILRVDAARNAELTEKGEARDGWAEARHCLSTQETALRTLAAQTAAAAPDRATRAQAGTEELLRCATLLRALTSSTPSGSGSALPSSDSLR